MTNKTNDTNNKRAYGPAAAALIASLAMVGGSFAVAATASADTTTSSTTSTTASTTTTTSPVTSVSAVPNTSTTLSQLQALAAKAISKRVATLDSAITKVQGLTYLGSDQATLVTNMQADISGLQALGTKIAGDTELSVARVDFGDIFTQYRVYKLVLPDTALVVEVDHQDNVVIPAVQKDITTLQGEETSSTPKSVVKDVTDAQNNVNKATTATTGLATTLLGYTAQDWDANHNLLATAAGGARSSQWDLTVAKFQVKIAEHYFNHHKS